MADGELGRTYRDKEVIFAEGEEGHNMFVIQAGKVRITKQSEEGELHIVTLGVGEIFGEMALFDRLPRSATASAEGDARVLSIDKRKLFSTISKDPTVVLKIMETMSGTIRRLSQDFAALKEQKVNSLQVCMNVDGICRMILGEIRKHVTAARGMVCIFTSPADSLSVQASFGPDTGKGGPIPGNRGAIEKAVNKGEVVMQNGDPAGIYIPLKCENTVFGLVFLERDGAFSVTDSELLGSFAAQASIALKNAISISGFSKIADELLAHAALAGPV